MEERILEYQKLALSETGNLDEGLLLRDGFAQDFEPWSGGRLSTIGSTKYLVEWKRLPASDSVVEKIRTEAQREIVKLVSVLSAIDAGKMFSLRAVKYFVSRIEPTVPFGIVYELPTRFDTPVQLSKLLETMDDRGNRILQHSLDQRFQLGRQIASAILFIHSVGWVHKGVQTSNIWMANRQSSSVAYPQYLGTAFLAGFDYTRREEGRSTGDETAGGGWLRQLYQHPDRVEKDSDEREYLPEHDIYALGVILVEIGRWKPLETYKLIFQHTSATERKRNLEVMADRLKITMGRRYVDVTLRCLRILDSGRASTRNGPAIRHILFDLEDLSTATA
jgi:serine/threonine protein kinase